MVHSAPGKNYEYETNWHLLSEQYEHRNWPAKLVVGEALINTFGSNMCSKVMSFSKTGYHGNLVSYMTLFHQFTRIIQLPSSQDDKSYSNAMFEFETHVK